MEVATTKMNRIIVLVACVVGMVAAGRIAQRDWQGNIGSVDQRIERMSEQDLQRQKFLLDIVQRLRQPLQQDDLLEMDNGLIVDAARYRGGIDGEMQRVIDLDRQRRLLDEHQIYSIRNVEHVQQLRGIYRMLVRAIDFETLQRNVVYLRRNLNPVLLINALTMAIRDREDTQNLIMPAIQEILPELYLDQQAIEQVQRMQIEVENSPRPSLMDMVGLGQRIRQMNPVMRMVMPWRDLHLQIAMRKQQMRPEVLSIQNMNNDDDISLLTKDIGMINFIHSLIQEIALLEDKVSRIDNDNGMRREIELEMEEEQRRLGNEDIIGNRLLGMNRRGMQQQQTNEDNSMYMNERERDWNAMRRNNVDDEEVQMRGMRVPLERNMGQGIMRILGRNQEDRAMDRDVNDLPTVDVRSGRLLHVGRRRQNINSLESEDPQSRFLGIVRGDRLSDGRRVIQEQIGQSRIMSENNLLDSGIDNLQSVPRNDERLVHINRRRLNQAEENWSGRRVSRIGEGRRVGVVDSMKDEDIVQLIRKDNRLNDLSDEEIIEMLRRNRQRKDQSQQERFLGLVRGDRLSEGRRVGSADAMKDEDVMRLVRSRIGQNRLNDEDIMEVMRRNQNVIDQIPEERFVRVDRRNEDLNRGIDSLQAVRRDDERLVHINRRRLNQPMDNMNSQLERQIEEGRRVDDEDLMAEEDIIQLIRRDNRLQELSDEQISEMLRRNRQRKAQENLNNMEHTVMERGNRYRRSVVNNMDQKLSRNSEVLLHTLRQLLARLNQERIAVRLANDESQLMDNSRLVMPSQDQAQRYAMRLNNMSLDQRSNRMLLDQINDIENRLQQVLGSELMRMEIGNNRVTGSGSAVESIDEQLRVERIIGDVLIGRIGDMGLVRVLRELLQNTNVGLDRSGLGMNIGDRVLQYALRRIVSLVDEIREQQLGAYKRDQLDMPDVAINELRVSKLRTRIENGVMDVSSLLDLPEQKQMMIRERRLSNKPFTIDMDISSKRPQEVIVRLFLGPSQDAMGRELPLEQRRSDFMLLDAINTELQAGRNRIQYRSENIAWTTRDATPYSEIYRRVMGALRGQQEQIALTELVGENGRFPQRLLLPRGRPDGLPMQLIAIVSPMENLEREQLMRQIRLDGVMGVSMASIMDNRPLGFPLDRRIDSELELLQLPNVQLQQVMIMQEN